MDNLNADSLADNLVKRSWEALNQCDHDKAHRHNQEFCRECTNVDLPITTVLDWLQAYCEWGMRTGGYKEALATLRANIKNFESVPELKFELLLNGARLECVGNQLGISSDLSIKALGLAEELEDHSLIARAYMQIASMFAKKYHGLSILEKARVIDPFGHAGLTPLGEIKMTLAGEIKMTPVEAPAGEFFCSFETPCPGTAGSISKTTEYDCKIKKHPSMLRSRNGNKGDGQHVSSFPQHSTQVRPAVHFKRQDDGTAA